MFEGTTEAQNRDSFSGEPAFLSGQMVCRDLMEHDAEIEEDVSEASDLSETGNIEFVLLSHVFEIILVFMLIDYTHNTWFNHFRRRN